jgi:hypothetical protein
MSAATPARKPEESEAARKIALYDAPGFLEVQRAQAALWLLEQIDGDHLTFSHPTMSAKDLEDWVRGTAKDAIAQALGTAEQQITEAVEKAGVKAAA